MTAVPKDPQISELRELFRHLQEFRAVYEATGLEEIRTPYGNSWSLWDLEYLLSKSQQILTPRQSQAISMCLVGNMREKDAARIMGVSQTNPVMMYATLGIRRLLDAVEDGDLERFRRDQQERQERSRRQVKVLQALADRIRAEVDIVVNDCWAYRPTPLGQQPRIRIRSTVGPLGFITIHPMIILYEALIGPLPGDHSLLHVPGKQHLACTNPDHGHLRPRYNREGQHHGALRYSPSPGAGGERNDLRVVEGRHESNGQVGHPHPLEGTRSA